MKILTLFIVLCFSVALASAQIPEQFSVSGQFVRADGSFPPDGPIDVTVSLYDGAEAPSAVWEATISTTIRSGVMNLLLGGPGQPPLPDFFTTYWIGVRTGDETFQPRVRISAVPQALTALRSIDGVPIGTIVPFAGSPDKIPGGWLACDGSAVSRTTFAILFGMLGTRWGNGDNVDSFNLPDLRGMVIRGASPSDAVIDDGVSSTDDSMYRQSGYSSSVATSSAASTVVDILYIIRAR